MKKPILALDFDGVIHSYTSGWQGMGVANDPPTEGANEFLFEATRHFSVHVYSSRSRSFSGRRCMKRYMRRHFSMPLTFSAEHEWDFLYEEIRFPWFKPPAMISLDDRAITFTGTWPSIEELKGFAPWNR